MEVYADITKSLLTKVPRFFQGGTAALQELAQNSTRAGASVVTITQDFADDQFWVSFEDNGQGIDDWSMLLVAGQTGWDDVVDPAGMGVFSYLTIAKTVKIASRGMELTFTEEILEGAAASLVPTDTGPDQGTRVTLFGVSTSQLGLGVCDASSFSRRPSSLAFFPFDLKIQQEGVFCKQFPKFSPDPKCVLPIPGFGYLHIGDIPDFLPYGEFQPRPQRAVWCGQTISYLDIPNLGVSCVWFIDELSGVLPRLPDRTGYVYNEAYHAAINAIRTKLDQLVYAYVKNSGGPVPYGITLRPDLSPSSPICYIEGFKRLCMRPEAVSAWVQNAEDAEWLSIATEETIGVDGREVAISVNPGEVVAVLEGTENADIVLVDDLSVTITHHVDDLLEDESPDTEFVVQAAVWTPAEDHTEDNVTLYFVDSMWAGGSPAPFSPVCEGMLRFAQQAYDLLWWDAIAPFLDEDDDDLTDVDQMLDRRHELHRAILAAIEPATADRLAREDLGYKIRDPLYQLAYLCEGEQRIALLDALATVELATFGHITRGVLRVAEEVG